MLMQVVADLRHDLFLALLRNGDSVLVGQNNVQLADRLNLSGVYDIAFVW